MFLSVSPGGYSTKFNKEVQTLTLSYTIFVRKGIPFVNLLTDLALRYIYVCSKYCFKITKWQISLPFHTSQFVNSLPFK